MRLLHDGTPAHHSQPINNYLNTAFQRRKREAASASQNYEEKYLRKYFSNAQEQFLIQRQVIYTIPSSVYFSRF